MKTTLTRIILALALLAWINPGLAQQRPVEPQPQEQPDTPPTEPAMDEDSVGELIQAVQDALGQQHNADETNKDANPKPRALRGQSARGSAGSGTNVVSLSALVAQQSTNGVANGPAKLRLNFRDASLSLVLDYLSEAAGFVVSPSSKVDLKGKVTVLASQPVSRSEAVAILHKALGEHNYAANVEGNILNIYVVDPSNTEIIAGVPDNNYTNVPPTKELVTQIVYVRNVEANTLISSLQPLMPSGSTMSAYQGANAIVITDTKANIRRMVQLVKALDTPAVSASAVEVIPLTYADATALAQVVTQLFQTTDNSNQGRGGRGGFGGFGFPGFGGGGGGGNNNNNNSSTAAGRVAAPKVTAVADERSNALIVTAPEDQMPFIVRLVNQMDVDVDAVTEFKVFRLTNADPQEMADQLTSLFPDPATQSNQRNRGFGFGPFGGFGGNNNNNSGQSNSTRRQSQAKVTAVADPRTQSVLISASRDMMPQIANIIQELDSDPSRKKKVHVIKVENRDPQELVQDLQSVIATDSSSGTFNNSSRNANQSGSQLNSRQQNNIQNQGQNQGFSQGFGQGNNRATGR